jgi:hypothetical protein
MRHIQRLYTYVGQARRHSAQAIACLAILKQMANTTAIQLARLRFGCTSGFMSPRMCHAMPAHAELFEHFMHDSGKNNILHEDIPMYFSKKLLPATKQMIHSVGRTYEAVAALPKTVQHPASQTSQLSWERLPLCLGTVLPKARNFKHATK